MRVKKYAVGGTVTSYPSYNNMPFVNLPEAEVLGLRMGYDRPWYYSDDTSEWEANRQAELDRARSEYQAGYSYMDPMATGRGESFSPMTYIHPVGDLEAILQAADYAVQGDIPNAALAGSLAAASVFLPGTFQTKSTMAGGVLERSLDKEGRIHPNAIRAIIDSPQTSPAEKQILSTVLEDALRGLDDIGVLDPNTGKINYREFKKIIGEYVPQLNASPSGDYSSYGMSNVFGNEKITFPTSYIDRNLRNVNSELNEIFRSDRIPGIHSGSVYDYIRQNPEWFSGLGANTGTTISSSIKRSRLSKFFDAVLSGDDAAFESLGLPVPDFKADDLGDVSLQGWQKARDFVNRKPISSEMIGLFPSQYNPSGISIPVSDAHLYDPGFGHFRATYDPETPNVAYITEIQSDAATNTTDINRSLGAPQTYLIDDGDLFNTTYSSKGLYDINIRQELEEALSQPNPLEYFKQKPMFDSDNQVLKNYTSDLLSDYNAISPKTGALLHSSEDLIVLENINDKLKSGKKLSINDVVDLKDLQAKEQGRLNTELEDVRIKIAEEVEPVFREIVNNNPNLFRKSQIYRMSLDQASAFLHGDLSNLSDYTPEQQAIITELIEKGKTIKNRIYHSKEKVQRLDNISVFHDPDIANALEEDLTNLSKFELKFFEQKLNDPVRKGLIKNYTERILQEAVGDIVSRNPEIKTIRIPVGETAAKIQGHSDIGGATRKYESMDKTIKRVFGTKPNKVKDSMNNQWWEFDLPEGGFEKQVFKRGGKVNIVKKQRGKFRIKK